MSKKILLSGVVLCCIAAGGLWYYTKYKVGDRQMKVPFLDNQFLEDDTTSTTAQAVPEGDTSTSSQRRDSLDEVRNLIRVSSVTSSQEISTPLVIEGEAVASWYDDEKFSVQIVNEQGKVLGSSVAQARQLDVLDEFIPFIVAVDFDPEFYFTGYVILQNAKEKSVSLKIPVEFVQKVIERTTGGCKITGCSGQVCSNQEAVTDCSYKEEYICYQKAHCERQPDGSCGWTQTKELGLCLDQFQEEQNTP